MKPKYLLTLVVVCIMTLMQSCTNDQDSMFSDSIESESSVSHMVVKFEDNIYETDVMVEGDSVIYLNQEYADMYKNRISILPDLVTIMTVSDGVTCVEYLASQKDVEKKYNFLKMESSSVTPNQMLTRGSKVLDMWNPNSPGPKLGYAELFDDKYFDDTVLLSYVTTSWYTSITRLTDVGFNDKCSSIRVYNTMNPASRYQIPVSGEVNEFGDIYNYIYWGSQLRPVLVSHHNSDFKGSILYCIAPPSGSSEPHMDYNLRNIGWNDKISSIEWILVYDFTQWMKEHEDLPHKSC